VRRGEKKKKDRTDRFTQGKKILYHKSEGGRGGDTIIGRRKRRLGGKTAWASPKATNKNKERHVDEMRQWKINVLGRPEM